VKVYSFSRAAASERDNREGQSAQASLSAEVAAELQLTATTSRHFLETKYVRTGP
jgi:hypothetical protein